MLALISISAVPAYAGFLTFTTVAPKTTSFSAAEKHVDLTATVSVVAQAVGATLHGVSGEGMVTFQVKSGATPIGPAVTDTSLTQAGVAVVSYKLPAGTGPGDFTIEASFSDGGGIF